MQQLPQGAWVEPGGAARPVRLKGALEDAFMGVRRREGDLTATRGDLARAYAGAVWAYRCIKLRADALAGVPLVLRGADGAPLADHPLTALLAGGGGASPAGTLPDLLRATEAAYNIWGVAYWLVVRGARGTPRRLVWLNPQTVEAVADAAQGITAYRQTVGGQTRLHPAADVIAFRNFDPLDDTGGLSPLSVALSEVNADLNAARYVAAFFANDARPAGLLTTDQPLHEADMERAQAWWGRLFRGARNRWKTGIVGGGLKWQPISFAPTDLALGDLRAEDRRAICAVFGVPPGLAGAWEAMTYATAREQKATFYEDTILPQLDYLAGVLNAALLPRYPDLARRGGVLVWGVEGIAALRESAGEQARRLIALYRGGLVTRNEARTRLGLPAVEAPRDGFAGAGRQPEPEDGTPGEASIKAAPAASCPTRRSSDLTPSAHPADGRLPLSVVTERGKARSASDGQGVRSRAGGASSAAKSKPPFADPAAADELRGELRRWERFAVKRVRAGRRLRPFRTTVIPAGLWQAISEGLAAASSVEDVFALFGDVFEALEGVPAPAAPAAGRNGHEAP